MRLISALKSSVTQCGMTASFSSSSMTFKSTLLSSMGAKKKSRSFGQSAKRCSNLGRLAPRVQSRTYSLYRCRRVRDVSPKYTITPCGGIMVPRTHMQNAYTPLVSGTSLMVSRPNSTLPQLSTGPVCASRQASGQTKTLTLCSRRKSWGVLGAVCLWARSNSLLKALCLSHIHMFTILVFTKL